MRVRRLACPLIAATLLSAALLGCGSSGSGETSPDSTGGSPARSTGAEPRSPVRVPKVVGVPFQQAVRELRERGLKQTAQGFPGTLGNPNLPGGCITVSSQAPPPGARVARGSTVTVVVGLCKRAVVPGG